MRRRDWFLNMDNQARLLIVLTPFIIFGAALVYVWAFSWLWGGP